MFTSTEAEPDSTFRLKAPGILSPPTDMWSWHGGAVEGPELWQSTVFCLGSLSLVSFSPMLAWRNQGNEILRRVLPPAFGGLLGLVTVAMMMFDVTGCTECHWSCWATLTITFLLSTSLSSEHFTSLPSNSKSYFPCNCCINKNVLPINKIYSGPDKYSRSAAINVIIKKMKASGEIIQVIILITVWQRDCGDW